MPWSKTAGCTCVRMCSEHCLLDFSWIAVLDYLGLFDMVFIRLISGESVSVVE